MASDLHEVVDKVVGAVKKVHNKDMKDTAMELFELIDSIATSKLCIAITPYGEPISEIVSSM